MKVDDRLPLRPAYLLSRLALRFIAVMLIGPLLIFVGMGVSSAQPSVLANAVAGAGWVIFGGAAIAVLVLTGLAINQLGREASLGYTTAPRAHQELEQRDPYVGDAIRSPGRPFLSSSEFRQALAGAKLQGRTRPLPSEAPVTFSGLDFRGEELTGVDYRTTDGDSDGEDFDVVGIAVTLSFKSGRQLPVSWKMTEGEGFLDFAREFTGPNQPGEMRNASLRWMPLLRRKVIAQAASVLTTEVGSGLWAIRLSFSDGESLVIALGERTAGGPPRYFPDSLIVTSLRSVATAFVPVDVTASAWGE